MSRNSDLHKVTLNIRAGDWDYLESICKPNGISTSQAVRTIIATFVDKKKAETHEPTQNYDFGVEL